MKYKFPIPYPTADRPRAEWAARNNRVTEMTNWINEQKWDHWGIGDDNGTESFFFANEDEYNWFVLRWS